MKKVLPENLRNLLKQPMGLLLKDEKLISTLKKQKNIVSIGDQVTYTILKEDIIPIFCVVDYKTRRGKCSDEIIKKIKEYGDKTIKIDNPQGCITDELYNAIKDSYKNMKTQKTRIEIKGEEDLSSLVAIYLAPADVTVIYGLPDKGVLVVKPNKENKDKIKKILDMM